MNNYFKINYGGSTLEPPAPIRYLVVDRQKKRQPSHLYVRVQDPANMEKSPEGIIGYSFMMEKIAEFRPGANNELGYEVEAFSPERRTKEQYNSTIKPEDGVIHHKFDTLEGVKEDGWPQRALYDAYVNQTPDMYKADPTIGDEDMYKNVNTNTNNNQNNNHNPNAHNKAPFPQQMPSNIGAPVPNSVPGRTGMYSQKQSGGKGKILINYIMI